MAKCRCITIYISICTHKYESIRVTYFDDEFHRITVYNNNDSTFNSGLCSFSNLDVLGDCARGKSNQLMSAINQFTIEACDMEFFCVLFPMYALWFTTKRSLSRRNIANRPEFHKAKPQFDNQQKWNTFFYAIWEQKMKTKKKTQCNAYVMPTHR